MANNILFFKEGLKNNKVYKEVGNMFGRDKRNALVEVSLKETGYKVREALVKHIKRKLKIKKGKYPEQTIFKFNRKNNSMFFFFKDKNLRKQQDPTTLKAKSLDAFSIPDGPYLNPKEKRLKPKTIAKKIAEQKGKKKRKNSKRYLVIKPRGINPKVLSPLTNYKKKVYRKRKSENKLSNLKNKPGLYRIINDNVERLYTFSDDAVYPRQRIDFENQGIQLFKKYFPKIFFNKARDILGFQFK